MSAAHHRGGRQIWQWPLVLFVLICFGLVSALLGRGGVWWMLSWIALATPLAVAAICIHKRRRPA